MAVAALRNLQAALPDVVVVVSPESDRLAGLFAGSGARVTVCPHAERGMGASLAWGVESASGAEGWIVALADMPFIRPQTIAAVARVLEAGALCAAPFHSGRRGHPVGFAAALRAELLVLDGDEGARSVLTRHAAQLERVDCDDPGILRDIDRPADLAS